MPFGLSLFNGVILQKQSVDEIIKCIANTSRYFIALTNPQELSLTETRSFPLVENGGIKFVGSTIDNIIIKFYGSPFLNIHNYEKSLKKPLALFYYYKSETIDLISYDE